MLKKSLKQEISPDTFEETIKPEILTTSQVIEFFQTKGLISESYGGYMITPKGREMLKRMEEARDEIIAWGHPNITGRHETTFEITKDEEVGKKGDCIIGVKANKSVRDLNTELKNAIKSGRKVLITIEANGVTDYIEAMGSPALKLTHESDIVVRKSDYIDDRTLAILASKAARDIKRELIEKMKDPKTKLRVVIEAI